VELAREPLRVRVEINIWPIYSCLLVKLVGSEWLFGGRKQACVLCCNAESLPTRGVFLSETRYRHSDL